MTESFTTKRALTLDGAKKMAAAAETEARRNEWRVTIAIADDGGNLVFLQRLDGAPAGSVGGATGKARTAALFGRPTKVLEDVVAGGRTALLAMPDLVPLEGGLPIVADGRTVGGIGVGGATSSEDAQIAQAGIDALD